MDVLTDVLSWLRVEGTVTRRSEFSAPWGVMHAPTSLFAFMTLEKGSCSMTLEGQPPLTLEAGDVVMLAPGESVSFADKPSTPAVPYVRVLEECEVVEEEKYAMDRDIYPTIRYGGGGKTTVIRGWGLRSESYIQHPLLSLLPRFIHITYEQRSARPWLDTTMRFISHETQSKGDGSDMMIMRLVDVLFVQIIRTWLQEQSSAEVGWFAALRDGSIRHSIKLMHEFPADPWTVEALARAVGMSRSNFSARFVSLAGTSPLKYLTQLRMHLAANALKGDGRLAIGDVARQVGYESEASFGRAFKRQFGVSPGSYRKDG